MLLDRGNRIVEFQDVKLVDDVDFLLSSEACSNVVQFDLRNEVVIFNGMFMDVKQHSHESESIREPNMQGVVDSQRENEIVASLHLDGLARYPGLRRSER